MFRSKRPLSDAWSDVSLAVGFVVVVLPIFAVIALYFWDLIIPSVDARLCNPAIGEFVFCSLPWIWLSAIALSPIVSPVTVPTLVLISYTLQMVRLDGYFVGILVGITAAQLGMHLMLGDSLVKWLSFQIQGNPWYAPRYRGLVWQEHVGSILAGGSLGLTFWLILFWGPGKKE